MLQLIWMLLYIMFSYFISTHWLILCTSYFLIKFKGNILACLVFEDVLICQKWKIQPNYNKNRLPKFKPQIFDFILFKAWENFNTMWKIVRSSKKNCKFQIFYICRRFCICYLFTGGITKLFLAKNWTSFWLSLWERMKGLNGSV